MKIHFTKMHGIGNDYIYIDGSAERLRDPSAAARVLSDRHRGIGSDGLILINPSAQADFEMEMYNADGSRGKMCGNGIRCVGKYVYDHGLTDKLELAIETLSGIRTLRLIPGEDGRISRVQVDMGRADFSPLHIPVDTALLSEAGDGEPGRVLERPFRFGDREYRITALSMGNPHCVIFTDTDVSALPLETLGPLIGGHPLFPEGVNVEFVNCLSPDHLRMRVYERGSGETMACGTGACAVLAAAHAAGRAEGQATVSLLGGDLTIALSPKSGHIFMTGPAEEVFRGEVELPDSADPSAVSDFSSRYMQLSESIAFGNS